MLVDCWIIQECGFYLNTARCLVNIQDGDIVTGISWAGETHSTRSFWLGIIFLLGKWSKWTSSNDTFEKINPPFFKPLLFLVQVTSLIAAPAFKHRHGTVCTGCRQTLVSSSFKRWGEAAVTLWLLPVHDPLAILVSKIAPALIMDEVD